jgi:aspartyl-tRNA(Asn)/glutamyl-tRNA(Gln) amidotransferase subunit C
MSLSRGEVERVSLLARLKLTDDELDRMTTQLGQIIEYMNVLGQLDTEGVEPMAHAVELSNVFREDVVRQSLPTAEALANSARHDARYFLVPAVLGE